MRNSTRGVRHARMASVLAVLLGIATGCEPGSGDGGPDGITLDGRLIQLPTPASTGSSVPNLHATDDGRVYLSWFDRLDDGVHALRLSSIGLGDLHPDHPTEPGEANGAGGAPVIGASPEWGDVHTIVQRDDFFVNWADFPSLHRLRDGTLAAHWLVRSGADTYDYDVHIGWSRDGGRTWSDPVVPHRDGTLSEHGFVSLFPWHDGSLGAAWLDGRGFAENPDHPEMSLRFTTLRAPGVSDEFESEPGLGKEVLLDGRVCDCCQTSAALTAEGPVVVYRDRTEDEVRDISIVRHGPDGWSEPESVHDDGWEIAACPVNGPMVAARGRDVAVAWFTAANEEPRVRLAFSRDGGRSFDAPLEVDDGDPVGRVAVILEPDGRAVVSWLERRDEGAEVRVRRFDPAGDRSASITVAEASAARASGFPRMVRAGDALVFAWNDVEGSGRVQVSALLPDSLDPL